MKQLYLIRHGVTAHNQQRRYSGVNNVSLSEQGVKQAQLVGELLRSENFSSIYTSPLQRCISTTEAISKSHDTCAESLEDLREIDFGLWEGLTFDEIQADYPKQLNAWFESPDDFTFPEGESVPDFRKRVLASLDTILAQDGDSLVVAHGGSLRVIICHLCGWGIDALHSFDLAPASLTIVKHYAQSSVVSVLNETCHLENGGVA